VTLPLAKVVAGLHLAAFGTSPFRVLPDETGPIMGNKLFVGGLKWEATEDDLREFFAEAGEITDAVVLHDRDTGRSRGFGFVTYATDEEAKAAVEKYNEADFMGRKLTVNEARQREDRSGGGGGGGGGRRDNW
jgi:cold-inducible RNA-binding protein|tara:strand:- start:1089 stop:1487 length:399 start_codon:yes stop_codon:yes gene_type:complete